MTKNKYSVSFNIDEVGNPEPCGSCHFNVSGDEVIVCLARSCNTQPPLTVIDTGEKPSSLKQGVGETLDDWLKRMSASINSAETY